MPWASDSLIGLVHGVDFYLERLQIGTCLAGRTMTLEQRTFPPCRPRWRCRVDRLMTVINGREKHVADLVLTLSRYSNL